MKSVAARATKTFGEVTETETFENEKNREALAFNCTDRLNVITVFCT